MKTIAAASTAGATLEWYDFLVYNTVAALVFHKLFFPNFDPLVGLMAAFATFGTGFVARPVGGAVFGHFGDKLGRKKMLIVTVLLAGGSTTLIGVLPTYGQIGAVAPLLLVLLRFAQGFGIGGEFAGATLLAVEHSPRRRRGIWGSIPQIGVSLGFLIAAGIVNLLSGSLSDPAFLSWGWRIPFLISLPLMAVGLLIRLKVLETPDFTKMKSTQTEARIPIVELVRTQSKTMVLALGAGLANTMSAQVFQAFAIAYVANTMGLPPSYILTGIMISVVLNFLLIPVAGALSDRIGRRPVYMIGVGWIALGGVPFFLLLNTETAALIWFAVVLAGSGNAIMLAVQGTFFSELFGTQVRYSGVSLAFQLAAVAGGFTPLIATAIFAVSGQQWWSVALFLIGIGLVSFLCTYFLSETAKGRDADEDEPGPRTGPAAPHEVGETETA